MSATNETGALAVPAQYTVEDALAEVRVVLIEDCGTRGFLERLAAMVEPLVIPTDGDGHILEAAYQLGFDTIDDDASLFVVSGTKLIEFVKRMRGPGGVRIGADGKARGDVSDEQIEVVLCEALADVRKRSGLPDPLDQALAEQAETLGAYRTQHRRLIRELDVALNGAAGAAEQASMSDLIAQVTRQQCVQVLNLVDGMRINFRAPDGRRATMYVANCLDLLEPEGTDQDCAVAQTMRDAIAEYPVAGVPE